MGIAQEGLLIHCVHYLSRVWLEDGGVTRTVLDFCRLFAATGNAATLVTGDPRDVPVDWRAGANPALPRGVTIDTPGGPFQLMSRTARSAFAAAIRDADVLHLHGPWETSNAQAAAIARRAGVPYLLSVHGMLDDWSMAQRTLKKRVYLKLAANRLLRDAARVHCTAIAELRQARRWLPRDNGVVLPCVVDLSAYADLPGPEPAARRFDGQLDGRPTLLFLSRVHPKKGVDLLIRAAAQLDRAGRPCNLLVAGPGDREYLAELEQLARREGIAQHTHFLGMVQGDEKLSLYQLADVFCLPTSQENFGLVLVEAMACGTPVITTRGVDIWEELQSRGATIVENDPASIARSIASLLDDPDARGKETERQRRSVLEYLDPTRVVTDYTRLIEQVNAEACNTVA
jgi:glycosyltransferase involved in cell wall biosynthesis